VSRSEETLVASLARPSQKRRRRWLLPALTAAFLLSLILLVFREAVLVRLGEFLVVSDPLEHADLIYVLAGDFWGSRVLLGAKLGSEGWAPKVVLAGGLYSGGGEVARYQGDLAAEFAVKQGYQPGLFLPVPMEAPSTVEEARFMGPIFHRLGAKRIILVTSNFHSRRALEVFRLFLPEFDFQMEASADHTFHPQSWWQTPDERHLLFGEYQKMVGTFLVRFHLASAGRLRQVEP
jgi:uncharacterized SAM-binding protein YcdF (DUF218 family)